DTDHNDTHENNLVECEIFSENVYVHQCRTDRPCCGKNGIDRPGGQSLTCFGQAPEIKNDHGCNDCPVPPLLSDVETKDPEQFEKTCQKNINPIFIHNSSSKLNEYHSVLFENRA